MNPNEGQEMMRRAEIAMRAGRAEQELRQRLAVARRVKTSKASGRTRSTI